MPEVKEDDLADVPAAGVITGIGPVAGQECVIVANDVAQPGIGFGSEDNAALLIDAKGGEPQGKMKKVGDTPKRGRTTGTTITFWPDPIIFAAEGIESAAEEQFFRQLGCEQIDFRLDQLFLLKQVNDPSLVGCIIPGRVCRFVGCQINKSGEFPFLIDKIIDISDSILF